MSSQLQRLTDGLQALSPDLDGWRIKARYISDAKWPHGNCRAIIIFSDLGDKTADIQVRRTWKTQGKWEIQYELPELIGHELGHLIVVDAMERFRQSKKRDAVDEIIASRIGRILDRARYDT